MSVHHPNCHHEGEGVKLLGNPIELLELILQSENDKNRVKDQIENEGPVHKQVFSALSVYIA